MTRGLTLEEARGGIDVMRSYALVLGSFVLAASATSCANPGKPGGGATPYPAVSPLAAGGLPNWIVAISPKGTAQAGAQVRVRFKNDVIPLDVKRTRACAPGWGGVGG